MQVLVLCAEEKIGDRNLAGVGGWIRVGKDQTDCDVGCEGPHGVSPWDGHVACCPINESADANCDNSELNRCAPVAVNS